MIEVAAITDRLDYVEHLETHCSADFTFIRYNGAESERGTLFAELEQRRPPVIIAGPSLDIDELVSLVSEVEARFQTSSIVAISSAGQNLIQLFRAGAEEVIRTDAEPDLLKTVLGQAAERAERRGSGIVRPAEEQVGRTIVVLCPKGGVGKTTISTNLAVRLAQENPERVALVDLDLQFGDVSQSLNLMAENTIADVGNEGVVDVRALKVSLTKHSSGLLVLASPDDLAAADDVTPHRVKSIVTTLADNFPYLIVDTAAGIDEATLAAAEQATDLMFIATTDVTSVRSLRRQLDAFDALGLTSQRRIAVVNRANSRLGMNLADIERAIDLPLTATIPSSTALASAANQGTSIWEFSPRDKALKSLTELAEHFLPEQQQPHRNRRWRR